METEYFGNATRAAVQKFQCAVLKVCTGNEASTGYGLVGKMTRVALLGTSVSTPTPTPTAPTVVVPTLTLGMKGVAVKALQDKLISLGYGIASTSGPSETDISYFGAKTKEAVQKFQCEKLKICSGNEATTGYGLAGKMTRAAMGI
jgi:peptidoglycan hydrolase-like protein with peptidoglycan-binding domain